MSNEEKRIEAITKLKEPFFQMFLGVVDDEKQSLTKKRKEIQESMKKWQDDFIKACKQNGLELPKMDDDSHLF